MLFNVSVVINTVSHRVVFCSSFYRASIEAILTTFIHQTMVDNKKQTLRIDTKKYRNETMRYEITFKQPYYAPPIGRRPYGRGQ